MKFLFHGKDDTKKETISSVHASDIVEATQIFAAVKRLSVEQFLKIYKLKEDGNKTDSSKRSKETFAG